MRAAGAEVVAEAVDARDARRVLTAEPSRCWLMVADPDLLGSDGLPVLRGLATGFPVAGTLLLTNRRGTGLDEMRDQAKQAGLNCIAVLRKPVSAEEMGTLLMQSRSLQPALREIEQRMRTLSKEELSECLRAGSVRARFQPKLDLESGRPVGCAAAPYVTHARYGVLHAAAFERALAQLGAQRVMTASLLRDAAELVRSLRERGLGARVAAKIGADMLFEPGDAASLDAYVRTLGVTPADLAFEIAAGSGAPRATTLDDNLARLKVRGYALAIDASAPLDLDDPALLHFSEIKLHLPHAQAQREPGMVAKHFSAMLGMARSQGMASCAVGVSSEADLADTRRAGFDLGQGELFAPAMNAEETLTWLAREEKARRFAGFESQQHQAG
jgi:EAL domain-containing protein (putative c-di-GMP-specific phosphodiesterase class I)